MEDELTNLMSIINKLVKCSKDNCSEIENRINKDVKLLQELVKLPKETNQKKINALLTKIYKNKLVIENNKCVLMYCLTINKELLEVIAKVANSLPLKNKKKFNDYFKETKKLLEKPNLTENDMNKIAKNFILLQSQIPLK